MNPPFFSIVMPAYDAAGSINGAIDAILAQTCGDWELIVVDDASRDDTAALVEAAAARDGRVRLVRRAENGGPAAARNDGIDQAQGTYLWMPDADDTFEPDLLERGRNVLVATDADVVVFGCAEEYRNSEGGFLYQHEIMLEEGWFPEPADWHGRVLALEKRTLFGYPWNKFYRLEVVRAADACFEDVLLIEDFLFNAAFFGQAHSAAFLEGAPYRYVKQDGRSLTNANAYSACSYYEVHRRRIQVLRDMLEGWDALDGSARAALGALYGRFVLSALERGFHASEAWAAGERRCWEASILDDALFAEFIPVAQADDSVSLTFCLAALRSHNVTVASMLGRILHCARERFYPLFTKIRSGR